MKTREYKIMLDENAINFHPATKHEEIFQNVITLLTTPKGTRAMDREYGIDFFHVDRPMLKEQARFTRDAVEAIRKYEPRVDKIKVDWGFSNKRNDLNEAICDMHPVIIITIKDDGEE